MLSTVSKWIAAVGLSLIGAYAQYFPPVGATGSFPSVTPTKSIVTYSATPTFTCTAHVMEFEITLTGNVTSSILSGCVSGDFLTFRIIEDGTGSRTFVWPTGFTGACAPDPTLSVETKQLFYWDGTVAVKQGGCTSSGTNEYGPTSVAPGNPPASNLFCWNDSTTNTKECIDSSGNVTKMYPITSPTFVTPLLGTPTSGVMTNVTGLTEAGQTLADNTTLNVSTSKHGYVPKLPNDATKFLDGTGAFTTVSGFDPLDTTVAWGRDDLLHGPVASTSATEFQGELNWSLSTNTGGTANGWLVGTVNHPGLLKMLSGTNNGDVGLRLTSIASSQMFGPPNVIPTSGSWEYRFVFNPVTYANTAEYDIGLDASVVAGPANANSVYIRAHQGTDTNWSLKTCSASTCGSVVASTTAIVANVYAYISIKSTAAGTVVATITQNGTTSTATSSTNIPSVALQPFFYLNNAGGTQTAELDVDFFAYKIAGLVRY